MAQIYEQSVARRAAPAEAGAAGQSYGIAVVSIKVHHGIGRRLRRRTDGKRRRGRRNFAAQISGGDPPEADSVRGHVDGVGEILPLRIDIQVRHVDHIAVFGRRQDDGIGLFRENFSFCGTAERQV